MADTSGARDPKGATAIRATSPRKADQTDPLPKYGLLAFEVLGVCMLGAFGCLLTDNNFALLAIMVVPLTFAPLLVQFITGQASTTDMWNTSTVAVGGFTMAVLAAIGFTAVLDNQRMVAANAIVSFVMAMIAGAVGAVRASWR